MNSGVVVRLIVVEVLDRKLGDMVRIRNEEDVDFFIKAGTPADIIWIEGGVADPVFRFWQMLKARVLGTPAYLIFTGVDDSSKWRDLRDLRMYESVKFGKLFLLVCDAVTRPKVVPSQRGIFLNGEGG